MSTLIKEVDARTRLAGANQMELLLFGVGTGDVYGINVFKVREVMKVPVLTRVPDADPRIEGLANIRGCMVPVVGLTRMLMQPDGAGASPAAEPGTGVLIITEYNRSLQAFHVGGVERIMRTSWSQVLPPPPLVQQSAKGSVTAVTMLDDGRMALILDVEKILSEIAPRSDEDVYASIDKLPSSAAVRVLFADDSSVARTQIRKTLERMGIAYVQATSGVEAWEMLQALADKAAGRPIRDEVRLVLSDIEMPGMDGFTLTKQIRSDPRMADVPVLLHSSLTGTCNIDKGRSVGATDYITKFDPKVLGEKIKQYCAM
jgi:two-component system chemotaxis response regulator CheV